MVRDVTLHKNLIGDPGLNDGLKFQPDISCDLHIFSKAIQEDVFKQEK